MLTLKESLLSKVHQARHRESLIDKKKKIYFLCLYHKGKDVYQVLTATNC